MNDLNFNEILRSDAPIHLIGVGGVSMRALARMLKDMGAHVRGSDRDSSIYTLQLDEQGIPVAIGHRPDNVRDAGLVIRTAAIKDDNPEVVAARAQKIPVISRAEAWGFIMEHYSKVVCVAGTHGKTSTTAMIATFAETASLDPTVMVGGDLPSIGGTLRIGHGELFVAEACEYQNSFLSFHPTLAVILNIDRDHLDFFKDTDDIIASFRTFAQLTPANGAVILNGDDENCRKMARDLDREVITFGFGEDCDVRAVNQAFRNGLNCCDVLYKSDLYCRMALKVPGDHNLMNALSAAAVAIRLGVPSEDFANGIGAYNGVGRRFEFKRAWRDAKVYDDYSHHPTEIEAALKAARSLEPNRVVCVFQPHTYSRTVSLLDEFAQALSHADKVILCPIFAAREVNTYGVSSEDLAKRIPGAEVAADLRQAAQMLGEQVQPGDLIFTMGAGDVCKLVQYLN